MAKKKTGSRVTYKGPAQLADDMQAALKVISSSLTVTASEYVSHTHLDIVGFDSPDTLNAVAVYLVGSIAQCIQADMQIREALFDDATRSVDLLRDVIGVIGDATATDTFKTMNRDPWIWEAISHLIVHLAKTAGDFHPSGKILAKTLVKYDVNDHGLDVIAIYDSGQLGITAGESKAYLNDPSRAITDAANRLSEVDKNLRDADIRATVNQLRPVLTASQSSRIGGAFWKSERTYYPFVCCDHGAILDWSRNRKTLRDLAIPVSKKLLVPLSLPNARDLFDALSNSIRDYASGSFSF